MLIDPEPPEGLEGQAALEGREALEDQADQAGPRLQAVQEVREVPGDRRPQPVLPVPLPVGPIAAAVRREQCEPPHLR
jgi:hypothetical protein